LLLLCAGALAQNQPARLPGQLGEDSFQLMFPNADVTAVLEQYEALTGKRLVRDQTVQGPLYIVVTNPVSREDAIKIIEMSLLMNGFSLVPSEDPKIVKVFGIGKNPRSGGVPIYSDPDLLPETEQVVTYIFKLQHADPTELAQLLGQAQFLVPRSRATPPSSPCPKRSRCWSLKTRRSSGASSGSFARSTCRRRKSSQNSSLLSVPMRRTFTTSWSRSSSQRKHPVQAA
jgi:hypothetical protein